MKNFTIPKPCHENWDKMLPEERGRFCSSCQTKVYDFTHHSTAEIEQAYRKENGNICGRMIVSKKIKYSRLQRAVLSTSHFTQNHLAKFGFIASLATLLLSITGCQRKLIEDANNQKLKDSDSAKTEENSASDTIIVGRLAPPQPGVAQMDSVKFREIEEVYVTGIIKSMD